MTAIVDASAVLAVLRQESGFEKIADRLETFEIGLVNLSEVIAKLCQWGATTEDAYQRVLDLGLTIAGFDREQAVIAGGLRPATKSAGLSLGDRACLALAIARGERVVSTDRAWAQIDIGVEIELIR